jgi:hypothetical protein
MEMIPHVSAAPERVKGRAAHVQAFKRDATLQLFLKQGSFWQRIDWARSVLGVTPRTASSSEPTLTLPEAPLLAGTDTPAFDVAQFFYRLHNELIPTRLRSGNKATSALIWRPFLIHCVCYRPAAEYLLHYADASEPWSLTEETDGGEDAFIVHVDPDDVRMGRSMYWLEITRLLAERLDIDFNTKIFPIIMEIQQREQARLWEMEQSYILDRPISSRTPAIPVYEGTTKADVVGALKAVHASSGGQAKRGTPDVDDLTAIQCLMWKLRCNATNPQIAVNLGREPSSGDHANDLRSVSVENYLKRGDELLTKWGIPIERYHLYRPA